VQLFVALAAPPVLAFLVEDQGRLITEDAIAVETEDDLLLLLS
jgi:hypothetical protein